MNLWAISVRGSMVMFDTVDRQFEGIQNGQICSHLNWPLKHTKILFRS